MLLTVPRRANSNGKWTGIHRISIPHYLNGRKGAPISINGDPIPSEHTVSDALELRARIEELVNEPISNDAVQAKTAADGILAMMETIHWSRLSRSYYHALSVPTHHVTLKHWFSTLIHRNYRARTMRAILCAALHPEKTTRQCLIMSSGDDNSKMSSYIIQGMKLHLRMHAFVKSEIEALCGKLWTDLDNGGLTAPNGPIRSDHRQRLIDQLFLPSCSPPAACLPTPPPVPLRESERLPDLVMIDVLDWWGTDQTVNKDFAIALGESSAPAPASAPTPAPPPAPAPAPAPCAGDCKEAPICLDDDDDVQPIQPAVGLASMSTGPPTDTGAGNKRKLDQLVDAL